MWGEGGARDCAWGRRDISRQERKVKKWEARVDRRRVLSDALTVPSFIKSWKPSVGSFVPICILTHMYFTLVGKVWCAKQLYGKRQD